MRVCLTCRFVSPGGSLLCGHCGRSFGGRLCPSQHLSPAGAQVCVQCGRKDLTEATPYLTLGWVSRLLAWAGVLLLVSLLSHHGGFVIHLLATVAAWAMIHILNLCPCMLLNAMIRAAAWFLALLILSWLLPGGAPFRSFLISLLRNAARLLCGAVRHAFAWLHRMIEGKPQQNEQQTKRKKKL